MITIRLTEQEYQKIHAVCDQFGAPSISDLARTAIHALLTDHPGALPRPDPIELRFEDLLSRLNALEKRFDDLSAASAGRKALHASC